MQNRHGYAVQRPAGVPRGGRDTEPLLEGMPVTPHDLATDWWTDRTVYLGWRSSNGMDVKLPPFGTVLGVKRTPNEIMGANCGH
jgi:hypothetical protein